jgi:hypothetical protein
MTTIIHRLTADSDAGLEATMDVMGLTDNET